MKTKVIFSIFFIMTAHFAFAEERLRLEKADLLENVTVNGVSMQYLKGNVIFRKGEMVLKCDWARFNRKTEQSFLYGNVSTQKDVQKMTCDSLFVDSPKDLMIAYSNVDFVDTTYSLNSDMLHYFSELDSGSATGNAILIQDKQTIKGDAIEYKENELNGGVSYISRGNVEIIEDERLATCGEAIYNREGGKTVLRINPLINDGDQKISGNEIFLQYEEEELKEIYIPEKAQAQTLSSGIRETINVIDGDSTMSQEPLSFSDDMTGSILRGFFRDGELDSVRLEGMATTLYHIFEDSIYQGNNRASGDTIVLKFGEDDLESIFISGGSEGTYTPDSLGSDIDGKVVYQSDKIKYNMQDESTDLLGEANIDYTDMNLKAGFINVAWRSNLLKALPSSDKDSTITPFRPTMIEEGNEPMVGDTMIYNLDSQNGKVIRGKTKADDGYYHGKEIRNQNMDIFYIDDAIYTTCELEEPHFHFDMNRMKMINNDKVVARPIVLYIADIPIFGLPFGVFPHQKGRRHSGWIMPSYGTDNRWGGYINGLGYYWAINDYFDTKLTASFYDRDGITLRSQNNYSKRYAYNGSFDLETKQRFSSSTPAAERDIFNLGSNKQSDYVLRWNHRQKLRNNQSASVNASYYSSGDYNRRTGLEQQKRLNQQAVSNATYSKRWPRSRNSLSVNLSSRRDLMAKEKVDPNSVFYINPSRSDQQINIANNTFPQLAFSHSQRALFPTKSKNKKWYNNINYNYSSRFTNNMKQYYESETYAIDDSTNSYRWKNNSDGTLLTETFSDYIFSHSSGMNMSAKVFKYFNISPSLSLKSDWLNRSFEGQLDSSGTILKNEVKGFATRTTGSFNISMNTQIYGLLPTKIGKTEAIRHVISPSIGYSYRPDFSKDVFGFDPGYYQAIQQDNGEIAYFDRFSGTLAGGTPRGESQTLNLSVNNVFQAKIVDDDIEKKIDLFSWRFNTGKNFVLEQFQWSNINSSVRANVSKKLNLDFSMTHDWYDFDKDKNIRINKFKSVNGLPAPRLINARFSTGFRFSGKRNNPILNQEETLITEDTTAYEERVDGANLARSLNEKDQKGNINAGNLWTSSASFSFSYNNANPNNPQKTFWMSTNSTIQATKFWRIQYNARFDLINQNLVSHTFSIYRDLHCWEMSINWTPNGYASGLYLRINVKSPSLKDLKFEQRGGTFSRPSLFDR